MSRYIIGRLLSIIPVLFIVSFLVFLMLHLIPGDPVKNMLGLHAPSEAVEEMTKRLGLDKPLHIQYFDFIKIFLPRIYGYHGYEYSLKFLKGIKRSDNKNPVLIIYLCQKVLFFQQPLISVSLSVLQDMSAQV